MDVYAAPRRLPGTLSTCPNCRQPVVWATTVGGPRGPGGKLMAFEPVESPLGRAAVKPDSQHRPSRLFARMLDPDEDPFYELGEYQGLPHSAVCSANRRPPTFDGSNVTELAAWRRGDR
jgi:hypothetical protein